MILFMCMLFTGTFLNYVKILPPGYVWLIFIIVQEMYLVMAQLTLCASFIIFCKTKMPSVSVYNTSALCFLLSFTKEPQEEKVIFERNTATRRDFLRNHCQTLKRHKLMTNCMHKNIGKMLTIVQHEQFLLRLKSSGWAKSYTEVYFYFKNH